MGMVEGLASDALKASRFLYNLGITFLDLSMVKAYFFWYFYAMLPEWYETIIFIGIRLRLFLLLLFLRLYRRFGLILSLEGYDVLSFLRFMKFTMMRVI
jgi:hypothetical protein